MANEIIVSLWGNGYQASLKRNPAIADWGSSPAQAIGRLVTEYPQEFGVTVTDKTTVSAE